LNEELLSEFEPLSEKIVSLEKQKANILLSISETHKIKNFEDFLNHSWTIWESEKDLFKCAKSMCVVNEIYQFFKEKDRLNALYENEKYKDIIKK